MAFIKVPTYRSKTPPPGTKGSGQVMFDAFAQPNIIGSAAGAQAQLGKTVTDVGLSVMAAELKISRDAEVRQFTTDFARNEVKISNEAVTGKYPSKQVNSRSYDPEQKKWVKMHIQKYDPPSDIANRKIIKYKQQAKVAAKKISDPIARERFLAGIDKRAAILEPQLRKVYRSRFVDFTLAQSNTRLDVLARQYVGSGAGIKEDIRKEAAKILIEDRAGGIRTHENTRKELKKFDAKITLLTYRNDRFEAGRDPEKMDAIALELLNPKGKYKNLDPVVRSRMAELLNSDIGVLRRRIDSEAEKKVVDNEKVITRRHKAGKEKVLDRMFKYKAAIRKNDQPPQPLLTPDDIQNMRNSGEISAEFAKTFIEQLLNPREFNHDRVAEHRRNIGSAFSKYDLRAVLETVEEDFDKGRIVLDSYERLKSKIEGRLDDVPQSLDEDRYAKRLAREIERGNLKPKWRGNEHQTESIMLDWFNEMVEREDVRPVDAFYRVMGETLRRQGVYVQTELANLPAKVVEAFGLEKGKWKGGIGAHSKFTLDMVAQARENFVQYLGKRKLPEGTDKSDLSAEQGTWEREERLSVRRLYRIEAALDMAERFIESREAAKEAAKQDPNKNQDADASAESITND